MKNRYYIFVHIKDLYAAAECLKRGFDPETKNLVVAKYERSDNTKCLDVSPAMKRLGIKGNSRLFDIPKEIKYVIAEPSMPLYYKYSSAVYEIFMRYFCKEDIAVTLPYEIFADITDYINEYKKTAREILAQIVETINKELGLSALAGVGTSLYLAKTAALLLAEDTDDKIAFLDSRLFKEKVLSRVSLHKFWFMSDEDAASLRNESIYTMADVLNTDPEKLKKVLGRYAKTVYECAAAGVFADIKTIKNNKLRMFDKGIFPIMKTRGFLNALKSAERIEVHEVKFSPVSFDEKTKKLSLLKKGQQVTLIYYEDGKYIKICGIISEIDAKKQSLIMPNKTLSFSDIIKILQPL